MPVLFQLTGFLAIGVFLHLLSGILNDAEFTGGTSEQRHVITISQSDIDEYRQQFADNVDRQPNDSEIQVFIDQRARDLMLIAEAFRIGIHKSDDVVNARVYKNVSFLELGNNQRQVESVRETMLVKDLVVQRRLLERMRALIVADVLKGPIGDDVLRSFYQQNQTHYLSGKRYKIDHQFVDNNQDSISNNAVTFFNRKQAVSLSNLKRLLPGELVELLLEKEASGSKLPFTLPPFNGASGVHSLTVLEIVSPSVLPFTTVKAKVKQSYIDYQSAVAIDD